MTARLFAILPLTFLVACGSGTQSASDTIRVTSDSPVEAKLAALEVGRQGSDQIVPRALVIEIDSVLRKLEQVCQQGRIQIVDMATFSVQQLRQGGHTTGYLEFLRGVDSLLTAAEAPAMKSTDCRLVFASALTVL